MRERARLAPAEERPADGDVGRLAATPTAVMAAVLAAIRGIHFSSHLSALSIAKFATVTVAAISAIAPVPSIPIAPATAIEVASAAATLVAARLGDHDLGRALVERLDPYGQVA